MNIDQAAKALKELGHPTRLAVYRQLIKSGRKGIAVGEVQEKLEIPGSTLSHHLKGLESAGLITQRREGRTLFCVAQYEQLNSVISFLQAECCVDEDC
ncbi:ArsR/SmtB family transcription factor [Neptunomonas japonica]|uniref:ArsR family transcriptional regulator n=1 Tax=Neptunomonas japonica JAMM 1380 TaxID=1441457 RepID=A0A7R6SWG7_9GAMM|nr:metalloregulator ArsR/SmtB family transcription factor [Neptunomonas japonica]BBB30421.1 ArsR family transcriptional regulator [Neptunomonas japonica JAMM 1380]